MGKKTKNSNKKFEKIACSICGVEYSLLWKNYFMLGDGVFFTCKSCGKVHHLRSRLFYKMILIFLFVTAIFFLEATSFSVLIKFSMIAALFFITVLFDKFASDKKLFAEIVEKKR